MAQQFRTHSALSEGPSSVFSPHIRQLATVSLSSSKGSWRPFLASLSTHTRMVHTHKYKQNKSLKNIEGACLICFICTFTSKSEREMGKEEKGRAGGEQRLADRCRKPGFYICAATDLLCDLSKSIQPLRTSVPISPLAHARCSISNAWEREESLYGVRS